MGQKYTDPATLTIAANAIAVAISEGLTIEQQNVLGNLVTLVGSAILSMAAIGQANQGSGNTQTAPADSTVAVR